MFFLGFWHGRTERYLSCLGLHSGSVIDGLLDEKKMETRQKARHFLTHCSFLNAKLSLGPRFSSNHFVSHNFKLNKSFPAIKCNSRSLSQAEMWIADNLTPGASTKVVSFFEQCSKFLANCFFVFL